jgi:hypothetical protein
MTAALREACGDLAKWLPQARRLITRPDTTTTPSGGRPGSRPPWNPAAAHATHTATEGIRRLEQTLHTQVTGRPRWPRGGSDGNTTAAITAVANLAPNTPQHTAGEAARAITSWVTTIQQLPAIDEAPRWERLRNGPAGLPPACPFCGCYTLRVAVRSGMVICVLPGCADGNGHPPRGRMEIGRVSAQPQVAWDDGTTQTPP